MQIGDVIVSDFQKETKIDEHISRFRICINIINYRAAKQKANNMQKPSQNEIPSGENNCNTNPEVQMSCLGRKYHLGLGKKQTPLYI